MSWPARCFAIGVCAALSACSTLSDSSDKLLASRQQQADKALAAQRTPAPETSVIHDRSAVLGILENSGHGDSLPQHCDQPVTFRVATPLGLPDLAARLSQILMVPVQVDHRLLNDPDDRTDSQPPVSAGPLGNPPGFPSGRTGPALVTSTLTAGYAPDLSGSCGELLDLIAGAFDVHWRMRNGILSFDKYVISTFPIRASATSSQFSSSMTSGGNSSNASSASPAAGGASASTGAGGSSGGAQSASVSVNSDVWGEIEAGLKSLMSKGGKYTISRSTGTITVIARPRVMADISAYLDQMNSILGATIVVEVSAIYITVDDTDNYGLDLNAVYQAGMQKISLSGLLPSIAQAQGTGSIAILSPPPGKNNFATHFAGSQLFLNAVSSSNRLADYRSATVSGRNGVAMPITLTTNQDIVRSLQFAVGLQSGAASTAASTSTINYGFSLEVLPRIIAPGVISVFLSFNTNDLTNLQDFPVGDTGKLELATIDSRSLWNESPLRAGQTLVIAGTEQETVNPQTSGMGTASNWFFGGQLKNEVKRTRLILLVTPSIMPTPL